MLRDMHGAGCAHGEKGLSANGWSEWARCKKKRLEMKVYTVGLVERVPFHRRVC